ncbi:MAG: DUF4342 domain-containing protein [Sarcina sp.]
MERNDKKEMAIIEVNDFKDDFKKENSEDFGGLGEIIVKIFRFIGKIIRKGNTVHFEVRKKNEKTIRISLTLSAVLLVFLTVPVIILLVSGLFLGYKYSISGENLNCDGVNDVFEEISKSADTIKEDFKSGL